MEQSKFSKLITALYYLWLFWFGETLASKIFFISFYSNVGLGLAAKQSLKVVTPYLSLSFTLHYLNPQPALHSVYELIQEMRRWIESRFFTTDLKQGRTKQVSHHFHHYHCRYHLRYQILPYFGVIPPYKRSQGGEWCPLTLPLSSLVLDIFNEQSMAYFSFSLYFQQSLKN